MAASVTRPTTSRVLLSIGLLYGFGGSWSRWGGFGELPHAAGLARWVDLSPLTGAVPAGLMVLVLLGCAVAFALRVREVAAALVALLVLGLASNLEMAAVGAHMPGLAQMLVGSLMAGWTVALVLARSRGWEHPDVIAHEAACGVLGATFTLSGLAKLAGTGARWMDGEGLSMMVYQHAVLGPDALEGLRLAFATTPGVPAAAAAAVVGFELSGLAYVWPRNRRLWSLASFGMFAGFFLLMDLAQVSWAVLPVALAWSPLARGVNTARGTPIAETPAVLG